MNHISLGVQEFEVAGGRLFVAPTKAKDVVSFVGSVLGGPNFFLSQNDVIPQLAAELLDAGSTDHKKDALREALAARGITLSFGTGGDRTTFSGSCFPEDLPFLLSIVAECVGKATFPEKEVALAKTRELGRLAEAKTDTETVAHIALSQALYDPTHVNYVESIEKTEKKTKDVKRKDLIAFQKQLGIHGLVLAVTGDVTPELVRSAAEKTFGKFRKGAFESLPKKKNTRSGLASQKKISIGGKANVDVYLGATTGLTKKDALYHPLMVVAEMLGGGFAAHLTQTLRERDGLTYCTVARLGGFADGADGHFEVYASFNPARYEESVERLYQEVRAFFTAGLTEDALLRKKEEIIGSYLVSLSTSRGLARALHQLATDDRPLSFLTDYPNIMNAITLSEAHRAADLVPFTKLSLAAAGTFKGA